MRLAPAQTVVTKVASAATRADTDVAIKVANKGDLSRRNLAVPLSQRNLSVQLSLFRSLHGTQVSAICNATQTFAKTARRTIAAILPSTSKITAATKAVSGVANRFC